MQTVFNSCVQRGAVFFQTPCWFAHPINTPTRRQRSLLVGLLIFRDLATTVLGPVRPRHKQSSEFTPPYSRSPRVIHNSELGSSRRVELVQWRRCCTCCSISPFQAPAALAKSSPNPQCCRGWKETIFSEYRGDGDGSSFYQIKKSRESQSGAPIAENRAAENPCRRIQVR
jgi:hypothetical protein